MNVEEELNAIFQHPAFDHVKPKQVQPTTNDRLIQSFEDVNLFFENHGRLPQKDGDINEKRLEHRFKTIISDPCKIERCLSYDRNGLLSSKGIDVESELEALFNNPIFALSEESMSLFDVPLHLQKKDRLTPDFVAKRKKCLNFELFEAGFKQVHAELKTGKRSLIRFHESHFQDGTYFLVGGVLVLLNKVFEAKKDKKHRVDGRTHCIFENGTESNLFLQSLRKAIYLDGYTVQENKDLNDKFFKERFKATENDIATGYIYVLRTKSKNPAIMQYKNLYKIGFTTKSVEERIAHAAKETTYLMDEVEIVATWKAHNLNTSYFENKLHHLFKEVRLEVNIYHESGITITPKEWFVVPLPIIKTAIEYIISGIAISYNAKEEMIEVHETNR